jgi:Zinc finger, C3HC4 type (RING finger)
MEIFRTYRFIYEHVIKERVAPLSAEEFACWKEQEEFFKDHSFMTVSCPLRICMGTIQPYVYINPFHGCHMIVPSMIARTEFDGEEGELEMRPDPQKFIDHYASLLRISFTSMIQEHGFINYFTMIHQSVLQSLIQSYSHDFYLEVLSRSFAQTKSILSYYVPWTSPVHQILMLNEVPFFCEFLFSVCVCDCSPVLRQTLLVQMTLLQFWYSVRDMEVPTDYLAWLCDCWNIAGNSIFGKWKRLLAAASILADTITGSIDNCVRKYERCAGLCEKKYRDQFVLLLKEQEQADPCTWFRGMRVCPSWESDTEVACRIWSLCDNINTAYTAWFIPDIFDQDVDKMVHLHAIIPFGAGWCNIEEQRESFRDCVQKNTHVTTPPWIKTSWGCPWGRYCPCFPNRIESWCHLQSHIDRWHSRRGLKQVQDHAAFVFDESENVLKDLDLLIERLSSENFSFEDWPSSNTLREEIVRAVRRTGLSEVWTLIEKDKSVQHAFPSYTCPVCAWQGSNYRQVASHIIQNGMSVVAQSVTEDADIYRLHSSTYALPVPERSVSVKDTENVCNICMEAPAIVTIRSCNHTVFCNECVCEYSENICPLCRSPIDNGFCFIRLDTCKTYAHCEV